MNLQLFAKDGPGGEKTEPATSKKLDDIRKEGQVAKSKELITAVSLMSLFIMLKVYVGKTGTKLIDAFTTIYNLMGKVINESPQGLTINMASGIVREKQYLSIIIMVAAFIANYFYKVSAIVLILICIALGVVLTLYREKKAKKNDRNTSQDNAQKGGAL
jgi:flagellar biosynthetic protein FlhB